MTRQPKNVAEVNQIFLKPYLTFLQEQYNATWEQIANTYRRSTLHHQLCEVERRYHNVFDNKIKIVMDLMFVYCNHATKYYPLVPHLMLYNVARRILSDFDISIPSIDDILGEGTEVFYTLNGRFNISMIRDHLDKLIISPQPQTSL